MVRKGKIKVDGISKIGTIKKDDKNLNFWVLKDISFECQPGTILGLVGINEAGKSSLCEILVGEKKPTQGEIFFEGSISKVPFDNLAEDKVSGIEAIHRIFRKKKLSKRQISSLTDEIVTFSELGHQIQKPVSSYSKEQQIRLEIAIAVFQNSDLLIIDESLSLTDEYFTKKVLAKLEELRDEERIIILVDHSINNLSRVCDKLYWINFGTGRFFEDVPEGLEAYKKFLEWFNQLDSEKRTKFHEKKQLEASSRLNYKKKRTFFIPRKILIPALLLLLVFSAGMGMYIKNVLQQRNVVLGEKNTNSSSLDDQKATTESSLKEKNSEEQLPKTNSQSSSEIQKESSSSETTSTSQEQVEKEQQTEEENKDAKVHTVQAGETLSDIAAKYGLTTMQLKEYNFLQSNEIHPGDQIALTYPEGQSNQPQGYYEVQKGDTLYSIAQKYGMTVEDLMSLNKMTDYTVRSGQQLSVSGNVNTNADASSSNSNASSSKYLVQKGDTYYSIARKYGVSVASLQQANPSMGSSLIAGKELTIPQ